MSRTIAWVSGSFLFMALTVYASYQYNTINKKEGVIKTQKSEIIRLDDDLFEETQLRMAAEAENIALGSTITVLRDSVALLKDNIYRLKKKVWKQDKDAEVFVEKTQKFRKRL